MGKVQTFESLQQAVALADLAAMRGYLADDFVLHEPPALPFGGDFFGPEGYLDLVRQLQSYFELEVVSSRLTEARDDLLLCELVIRFKSRQTGESSEMSLVDLYHFDADGKICRVDGYYMDPDMIASLALGRPRPVRPDRAA
jgi:ketosteroid isomerase-like protein